MSYFKNFPLVDYRFGNETSLTAFRSLSSYSDIVDQIKDDVSFYTDYYIQEGERPDQLSYRFYNTATLHWLFYLLNDSLKESGWPLTNAQLLAKAKYDYPMLTLTTRSPLYDRFAVGQTISGNESSATATISHRHLDLGQVVCINTSGTFTAGETISSTNSDDEVETIVLTSSELEYLSAHHYENSDKEVVDIDPEVGPGASLTEITYLDRMVTKNNELKQIRVLKPEAVRQVVASFRESMSL